MEEYQPAPPESEVQKTELQEITEALIFQKKMPHFVGEVFRVKWNYPPEDEPKLSKKLKKEIQGFANECLKVRVDSERTGLELEVALREKYTLAMIDKVREFNGVVQDAATLSDII